MKRLFIYFPFVFLLSFFCGYIIAFSSQDKAPTMDSATGYDLYVNRVTEFCNEYKISDGTSETIYTFDESSNYANLDGQGSVGSSRNIENAREIYRRNMDSIYDCATSVINHRALETVKKLIANEPKLNSRLNTSLDLQLGKIISQVSSKTSGKCKISSEKNNLLLKKSILRQTTYELCRYTFYLEYLKEYNERVSSLVDTTNITNQASVVSIANLLEKERERKNLINAEIDEVYKAFPIAFKAYSEYENNLVVHLLLELVREDYIVLREELHRNLNPINQVVYKISNAMRK